MLEKPVVLVAARDPARAMSLGNALPLTAVRHIGDAENLLRESHLTPPDVVLLYTDLPSKLALPELLTMLRGRLDLSHTRWLAVGTQGLGPLLQAGADALMSDSTSTEALASQVRTLLERVRQSREQGERLALLQRRMDSWEHEERVRDQLVHMLVHDLKNPIAAVMGLLEVVEDDESLSGESRELLKLAREETHHLLHLSVGVITILAQPHGGELLCTMRDDGEGIPEADIPNLFAAFEQSRLTLHGRFDTGMGLAFCKLAIEGHGGRIWVESVRGKGASFFFTLPLDLDTDDDDFADLLV